MATGSSAIYESDPRDCRLSSRGFSVLNRSALSTRRTARAGSSCSQILITRHPADRSLTFVSASRRRFVSILSRHHLRFARGSVPCFGQPCQKQPSTNTATFVFGKTMSAVRWRPGINRLCNRNRSPSSWSADRIAVSAGVSRWGVARIRFRTTSDDARGGLRVVPIELCPVPSSQIDFTDSTRTSD